MYVYVSESGSRSRRVTKRYRKGKDAVERYIQGGGNYGKLPSNPRYNTKDTKKARARAFEFEEINGIRVFTWKIY